MIQLLLDENVPPVIGQFLRDKGFNVKEVRNTLSPGTQDDTVISLARREQRALVTFDKHFSNLLVYPPDRHYGIIRIRIHPPVIADVHDAFEKLLTKFDIETMRGSLIVLGREGFRVRRAPLD